MRTPYGKECRYYYGDFHRGRNRQECRLVTSTGQTPRWKPSDCARCPVPDILWANASEFLELSAVINPGVLGFGRRVQVTARCRKHDQVIEDPHLGCAMCAKEQPHLFDMLQQDEA